MKPEETNQGPPVFTPGPAVAASLAWPLVAHPMLLLAIGQQTVAVAEAPDLEVSMTLRTASEG